MVARFAEHLVDQFEKEKLMDHTMREHYIYAVVSIIERFLTVGSIICLGFIHKNVDLTVLFMIFFFSLRKRTGGYHAKHYWQCYIMTIIVYMTVMYLCHHVQEVACLIWILLGISVVVISVIGTVNHPNLDLDAEEMQISQKSARYVLLIECGILCIAWYLRIDNSYVYCMMLAVILCGFLMILAKLLEQEVNRDEA